MNNKDIRLVGQFKSFNYSNTGKFTGIFHDEESNLDFYVYEEIYDVIKYILDIWNEKPSNYTFELIGNLYPSEHVKDICMEYHINGIK